MISLNALGHCSQILVQRSSGWNSEKQEEQTMLHPLVGDAEAKVVDGQLDGHLGGAVARMSRGTGAC